MVDDRRVSRVPRHAALPRVKPIGRDVPEDARHPDQGSDPEREALLADSGGRALLVALETLAPAERIAFVLHDMFAVPFDEIAHIVGRSPVATKKLASRARRRIQGTPAISVAELAQHRYVVDAFLAASRDGDLDALVAVLAPDVVRRADRAVLPSGRATEVRGARCVAEEIVVFGRSSRFAEPALVNGAVGAVVAPRGRLQLAIAISVEGGRSSSTSSSPTRPALGNSTWRCSTDDRPGVRVSSPLLPRDLSAGRRCFPSRVTSDAVARTALRRRASRESHA
jgi:hypothetical protein